MFLKLHNIDDKIERVAVLSIKAYYQHSYPIYNAEQGVTGSITGTNMSYNGGSFSFFHETPCQMTA